MHKYLTDLDRALVISRGASDFLLKKGTSLSSQADRNLELSRSMEPSVLELHLAYTYTRTIEQLMNQQDSKSSDQHYYIEYYNMMYAN